LTAEIDVLRRLVDHGAAAAVLPSLFEEQLKAPKGVADAGPDALTLSFQVHRVEYLGSERHVIGTVQGLGQDTRVIAMLPSTVSVDVPVDRSHEFVVAAADLRFFDVASGLRTEPRRL
ncbi:MAG: hypothetical protein KY450_12605, partial [Actinobacteria bacterium]|nr:hypothetical protein [Actinomycetota bacterium]